jgi:hypothetical protein
MAEKTDSIGQILQPEGTPLRWIAAFTTAGSLTILLGGAALGQTSPTTGRILVPPSSVGQPGDAGSRGHTNVEIFIPKDKGGAGRLQPPSPPRTNAAQSGGSQRGKASASPDQH